MHSVPRTERTARVASGSRSKRAGRRAPERPAYSASRACRAARSVRGTDCGDRERPTRGRSVAGTRSAPRAAAQSQGRGALRRGRSVAGHGGREGLEAALDLLLEALGEAPRLLVAGGHLLRRAGEGGRDGLGRLAGERAEREHAPGARRDERERRRDHANAGLARVAVARSVSGERVSQRARTSAKSEDEIR